MHKVTHGKLVSASTRRSASAPHAAVTQQDSSTTDDLLLLPDLTVKGCQSWFRQDDLRLSRPASPWRLEKQRGMP
jgi:hypothetical protein